MTIKIESDADTDRLLDCAAVHKADHLRLFLDNIGLAKSGTKDVLGSRLTQSTSPA
jgi:hypothetical protein